MYARTVVLILVLSSLMGCYRAEINPPENAASFSESNTLKSALSTPTSPTQTMIKTHELTAEQKKRLAEVLKYIGTAYNLTFDQAVEEFQRSESGPEWQLIDLELQVEAIKTTITNRVIREEDKVDALGIMSHYGVMIDHEKAGVELPKHSGAFYNIYRVKKSLTDNEAERLWKSYTNRTRIREYILKDSSAIQSTSSDGNTLLDFTNDDAKTRLKDKSVDADKR